MNWLTAAVLLFCALILFRSWRRGFVKTLFSMVFLILVIVCTAFFSPKMQTFLSENETVSAWVEKQCRSYIDSKADEDAAASVSGQGNASYSWLNVLPLPDELKENLASGNQEILGLLLQSDTVRTYLSEKMSAAAIALLAFAVTLILCIAVLAVIEAVLNRIANLPVLGGINRVLGFLLGAVKCLLLIWLVFLVIGIFASTDIGRTLVSQISGSIILKPLYENNLLAKYFPTALKTLL